jgi:hypothetical protein
MRRERQYAYQMLRRCWRKHTRLRTRRVTRGAQPAGGALGVGARGASCVRALLR